MKKLLTTGVTFVLLLSVSLAQTPQNPPPSPQEQVSPDDVIRITTELVQTDVVVTDKNDQVVSDLKLEDFELYDQGKKQDLKFMEFVGVDSPGRTEGNRASAAAPSVLPAVIERTGNTGVSAKDLKRVVAFVIDDLTMQINDLTAVRKMLLDFVDNKMRDGDLVAIVRVIGGKGLLQQFTTDRQLLRRAIAAITLVVHPYSSSEVPDPEKASRPDPTTSMQVDARDATADASATAPEVFSSNDESIRYNRGLAAVTTANLVIESLRLLPGRKNLVLVTEGIPVFEINSSGSSFSNTGVVLSQLTDNAFRAGVVISSLDPRGMRATPGVKGFQATPAKSAMGGGMSAASRNEDNTFGIGDPGESSALSGPLAGGAQHIGLSTVASYTGGVSVVNTDDFQAGLDKILARSNGYYTLAYKPSAPMDNKNHKLEIKVRRSGAKVYSHRSYLARAERSSGPSTKEEEIVNAALSPLVKADIDVTPNVALKLQPGKAGVEVQMLIGANKMHFSEGSDGAHHVSFDVVAFIFDQMGKRYAGLSETVNLNLTPEDYRIALAEGLAYTANTELPPGYYQVRAVVREASSGGVGTFSKYIEIPDVSKGKFAMSSVFLMAVDNQPKKLTPLAAQRHLSQKQELRYVAMIYNPKLKDGKPQLRSQMIISQGNKVLFREAEQAVDSTGSSPVTKMGQLVLGKVQPGHYVLTLVVTDTLADKKSQTVARSIDFNVGR
jgi:VWFA-related protein